MSWTSTRPDVVIFGIVPWGSHWQRPHHFAHQFVRHGHRVVYITPHIAAGGQTWRELKDDTGTGNVVPVQLAALSKDSIHTPGGWTEEDLSHTHHTFWCMADELRLRCPIMFVQSPSWWPLVFWIRKRGEFPVVYDCLDEHIGWNDEMAETVRGWEEELVVAADLVLASAPSLQARLQSLKPYVFLVPNGCDVDHFAPASRPTGVFDRRRSGPIVGYYGAISAGWFDAGLVVTLAESRPDWKFVLVGPADEDVQALLEGSPNILLLGEIPYAELPRYCADFDVAIIPFLVNELTAATDPVKLYEYFAAAKPVVSTPIPALYTLQGLLSFAEDAAGFERAIAAFLEHPGNGAERSAVAQAASWADRVTSFYDAMVGCLPSLDVVVIAERNRDSVRQCVERIRADSSYAGNLIIVENAVRDVASAWVDQSHPDGSAMVVAAGGNSDAGTVVKTGIGAGCSRYVLVMTSEVEVSRGTMLGLVSVLARSRDIGCAAAPPDRYETADECCQPRFDSVSQRAAFFEAHAWAHFGAESDADGSAHPVWIFRRSDLEMVGVIDWLGASGLAARCYGGGQKRAVVAEGVMVHQVSGGQVASIDPRLWQALGKRHRRRRLARRPQ